MANNNTSNVLLDLDGTLADTAPDLAYALNCVLEEEGHPRLELEVIKPTVSLGGAAMIKMAFGIDEEHENFSSLRSRFLATYQDNIAKHTELFAGMTELLDTLDKRNLPWGVVTNKASWLTDPLMLELGLSQRTPCIVSGDTVGFSKPHPAPLLYACELLECVPEETVYVGDAQRDIEAGRRASMTTLVARYGYIDNVEQSKNWGADGSIDSPMEILNWLTAE